MNWQMKNNIAIIAVGYDRKDSMERLLSSLNQAKYNENDITLIISIDKSNTDEVEISAEQFNWSHGQKIVDKHDINLGLRAHMLSLGKWFEQFDALIILEDDIVVSKHFYTYARQCFTIYKNNPDIAGISLYNFFVNYQTSYPFEPLQNEYDIYFMQCAMSWGEVWLKHQWQEFYAWYKKNTEFELSEEIPSCLFKWSKNSWLKYHTRYCIEQNKYFVYPYISYSTCYGDKGVHHAGYGYDTAQVLLQEGDKTLNLPEHVGSAAIIYDGFLENTSIPEWLGLPKNEITLDLNGTRTMVNKRRYLVSSKIYDYDIIKSYALEYHPIEANILYMAEGQNLFLYDTTIMKKNKLKYDIHKHYCYHYHIVGLPLLIRHFGLFNLFKESVHYLFSTFIQKITK